jgi:DNA phosphorothioation-dependent restriction protein DptH
VNRLSAILASFIRAKIDQTVADAGAEARLIFHGPPLEILSDAFDCLLADLAAARVAVPVLLQVPQLEPGRANPPVGSSGRCDDTHFLNLRNSPARPTFVALVPPGQHSNRSVSTTTDEFGMAASNNAGNVPFEAWWADEFLQDVVGAALAEAKIGEADREQARALIEHAAAAADEVDADRTQRARAWRVISRVCAPYPDGSQLNASERLSLACGLPRTKERNLSPREQVATLEKIAEALSEGFGGGISRAREGASEEDVARLTEFLDHLRSVCDLPTLFERSAATFYGPFDGLGLEARPRWWNDLTVEKWSELLVEEAAATGDIRMVCTNGIMPFARGMPVLVENQVDLEFETVGPEASEAVVTIERTPAGPDGKAIGQIRADSGRAFVDPTPPSHRSPMRYVASADRFKPGAIKVVSLATWAPGIYVACRLAKKLSPPKRRKGRGGPELESQLQLPGAGRYDILVFASPGVEVDDQASGNPDDAAERGDAPVSLSVRSSRQGHFQVEVEVDGNYQLDLSFKRPAADGTMEKVGCRVSLGVEEGQQDGCKSEFERLIRANRRALQPAEARTIVQPDRNARASSLQDWMLSADQIERSFQPIVIANDYVDAWVQPTWTGPAGPVFSSGRFLKDPRPNPAEFAPPAGFVKARVEIGRRIRGGGDETGLVESAQLGKWAASDPTFSETVDQYLSAYQSWLAAEPDVACWVDVAAVTTLEPDGRTLSRVPDAVLLSPLHPLRIAWHTVAQGVLLEADEAERPCPAVSVLDPDCVPDLLSIALRSATGVERVDFVAVENGSDYWSVLWNGRQLKGLAARSRLAPFGPSFGISVGGISAGFSAAQVGRALEDVSDLVAAKPVVSVAVASAGGATDACNEGLIEWCTRRYRQDDRRPVRQSVGPRSVDIYDDRDAASRPEDATIANLSEDTVNAVRWFDRQPGGAVPDLGIIAQLDMSEPSVTSVPTQTPIAPAALIRHRIRRQLPNAFLSESRQALPAPISGESLADKVGTCVAALENLGEQRSGLTFAPNLNAIQDMLGRRRTDYVAVSSSAIDPACFLGGWLEGAYLWDYDLPSYSQRAGDTNGYYLLSSVKDADREGLAKALSKLPGCAALEKDHVGNVLLEVARRGIPTVKGLAGDDAGATGNLGLFLAVRLLQDRFRIGSDGDSLLPVIGGNEDDAHLAVIVPVDPFRGYLSDLARSIPSERKDASLSRPDLLAIGIRLTQAGVSLRLTPVEVKCRPGSIFPAPEVGEALEQAKTLSRLMQAMNASEGQPRAWTLAFQHLMLSLVGFGMRVYSQHPDVVDQDKWSLFHQRIASAILAGEADIQVDGRGRLIIVDGSLRSSARDQDSDGFDETITIGLDDAGRIVGGDPASFYDSVRAKVHDWQIFPAALERNLPAAPGPVALAQDEADAIVAPELPQPGTGPQPLVVVAERPLIAEHDGGGIVLGVGTSVDGFEPRRLSLNISDTRLNHLNMGVVGDLGTGKTQLLKSIILQISEASAANRGLRPRFLIFDYKRDYSSEDFIRATGARVVKPHKLPINLFDTRTMEEAAAPWLQRYLFFGDVLDKIYSGIGPVQRDKLKRAIRQAYDKVLPGVQPTLCDVSETYGEIVEGKPDSVSSIIGDLVDMEVFEADPRKTIPFDEFLSGVVVVSLDALGQDDRSKNMLVAVMLNLFYENMLKTPKRPFLGSEPQLRAIDSYLLVDEADNIMRYEFDVLRKLLLQGREFGAGIILASQYLRHFKVNATDYRDPLLTWFIHKVPNVTPAELSTLGLTGSLAQLAERVKSLKNHQCLYKSFDIPGEVIRGLPFFELVVTRKEA